MTEAPLDMALCQLGDVARNGLAALHDDPSLLRAFINQRDQTAFALLVRRHGPMVLGVCRRMLGNFHDAEDAFQAVFLVLARNAVSVRKSASLASWLHGVAYRIAMKAKREAARRKKREQQAARPPQEKANRDPAWSEVQAALDEEIQRLPVIYQTTFVLCCLQGLGHADAARRLGVKEGTVAARLSRARNQLHRALSNRGISLPSVLGILALSQGMQAGVTAKTAQGLARAATTYAAGDQVMGLSANILSLAEGVLQTMWTTKLKLASFLFLALGLLGVSAVVMRQTPAGATERQAAKGQPETPSGSPTPEAPVEEETPQAPKEVVITGKVVDSQGKPVERVAIDVWSGLLRTQTEPAPPRAMTDRQGGFSFALKPDEVGRQVNIVALPQVAGYGPDWVEVQADREKLDVNLRLPVDDLPIEGQIVDLEGKPIAGATVRMVSLSKPEEGDLSSWLDATKKGRFPDLPRLPVRALGMPSTTITQPDGAFYLEGFGRERKISLVVRGNGIQQAEFSVITRKQLPPGIRRGYYGTYPARFIHTAGPGRAIFGTVKEKSTGKAIAGVKVLSVTGAQIAATTDEQGKYRIEGVGKFEKYTVAAGGKSPYFNATKHSVPDERDLNPLQVDFQLERGIVIQGRVIEKGTGKAVRGSVGYHPYKDNPSLRDYRELDNPQFLVEAPEGARPDGTFTVLGIPGKGALTVRAIPLMGYARQPPKENNLGGLILEYYHRVVPIEVDADRPETLNYTIEVTPDVVARGMLIDPDGNLLPGCYALGNTPVMKNLGGGDPLKNANVQIGGTTQQSRKVLFYHHEKKLSRMIATPLKVQSPLTIQLEPLGGIKGRIVDASGTPRAGIEVHASLTREFAQYGKAMPLDLLLEYQMWNSKLGKKTRTNDEGCFELSGLIPGVGYRLDWGEESPSEKQGPDTREGVVVQARRTRDLGELKSKPVK